MRLRQETFKTLLRQVGATFCNIFSDCLYVYIVSSEDRQSILNLLYSFQFSNLVALFLQEIAFFDDPKHNTGALCSRLATDASAVKGVR